MKSPRQKDAGRGGAADGKSIPYLTPHEGRLLETHCPCCLKPHHKPPRGLGCYIIADDLTARVFYYLCTHCGRTMEKAGCARRRRLTTRIEHSLEALGAFEGLRQA